MVGVILRGPEGMGSMAVSSDYLDFVLEQLAALGEVASRRMFGGVGLYAHGLFFALIADDVLYFKVDDANRPDFQAHDSEALRPVAARPEMQSKGYFAVPAEVLDDPATLAAWARKAVEAAARSKPPPKHWRNSM
jgi:DNA transformation protein